MVGRLLRCVPHVSYRAIGPSRCVLRVHLRDVRVAAVLDDVRGRRVQLELPQLLEALHVPHPNLPAIASDGRVAKNKKQKNTSKHFVIFRAWAVPFES